MLQNILPQTDRRTDRIAIAKRRTPQYLPVQLSPVKSDFLRGVPLFYALVRKESPHPAAPNYLIRN